MRRLLPIIALLMLAPLAKCQTTGFYTTQILGINPTNPPGQTVPTPIFLSYAPTRVCTLPLTQQVPCLPLASITDGFGNAISNNIGGAFGQISTDVTGRILFGCTVGLNYQIQTAATGTTPTSNYPITCPGGPNPTLANLTVTGLANLNGGGNLSGTFTGNYSTTGNNTHSGIETFKNVNANHLFVSQFSGATADAKISAAISACGTTGPCIVDALDVTSWTTATSQVSIPGNVTLLLPQINYPFNVGANNAAFMLNGSGATLQGTGGFNVQAGASSNWGGTMLQAVSPAGTTVGVKTSGSVLENVEVKSIGVDMNPTESTGITSGSDCFQFTAMSNSRFENLYGVHCGGNGMKISTSSAQFSHVYDNNIYHVRMQFVGGDNYLITTANGATNADIDRLTIIDATAAHNDPNAGSFTSGANGYHVQILNGAVIAQSIADISCINCFTTNFLTNGVFLDNASTPAFIRRVRFDGEIETSASPATCLKINNPNPPSSFAISSVMFDVILAGCTTLTNMNIANVQVFSFRDGSTASTVTDLPYNGPATVVGSLPTCNSALQDEWRVVTDATAPTYNGALTGGGAVRVPVYCNGSAWSSH